MDKNRDCGYTETLIQLQVPFVNDSISIIQTIIITILIITNIFIPS